jgi:hypothetical protein
MKAPFPRPNFRFGFPAFVTDQTTERGISDPTSVLDASNPLDVLSRP